MLSAGLPGTLARTVAGEALLGGTMAWRGLLADLPGTTWDINAMS